jgi:hypothetical protein
VNNNCGANSTKQFLPSKLNPCEEQLWGEFNKTFLAIKLKTLVNNYWAIVGLIQQNISCFQTQNPCEQQLWD